jgi:predicted membrane-bound spermidine synthase
MSSAATPARPPLVLGIHHWALLGGLCIFLFGEILGFADVTDYAHKQFFYFIKPGNAFFASACHGAFWLFLFSRPKLPRALIATGLGALFEVAFYRWRHTPADPMTFLGTAQELGCGLGCAALLLTVASALSPDKRAENSPETAWNSLQKNFDLLGKLLVVPIYIGLSGVFLHFTIMLHPGVLDSPFLAAESAIGIDTGLSFARWGIRTPGVYPTLIAVYVELPLALSIIATVQHISMAKPGAVRRGPDALLLFIVAGFIGSFFYHLVPVIGPRPFLENWPNDAPSPLQLTLKVTYGVKGAFRNCVPSLHTTWALLLYWCARPLNIPARIFGFLFLIGTLAATITLGEHYVLDLIMAFPFSLAIRSLFSSYLPWSNRARFDGAVIGSTLMFLWCILVLGAPAWLLANPTIVQCLMVVSVGGSWLLELRIARAPSHLWERRPSGASQVAQDVAQDTSDFQPPLALAGEAGEGARSVRHSGVVPSGALGPEPTEAQVPAPAAFSLKGVRPLLFAFAFSGFAGLVYEVIFAKELALTFGSTAKASTTVLATYMGGLALGSYLGARFVEKMRALRLYALAEFGVGLLCAASPWMFRGVRSLYISLALGSDPGSAWLTVLQLLLGALVLLPPTILMGTTMPALAVELDKKKDSLGRSIAALYAVNTLGAAAGAILAGYYLLPKMGIEKATYLAMGANFAAAAIGYALSLRKEQTPADAPKLDATDVASPADAPSTESARGVQVALITLGVGGLVTIALETLYIHLLAIVAGNSVFAFSLMLFCFLVGLGGGASFGRRWLGRGIKPAYGAALTQALLGCVVLATIFLWQEIPSYFASFSGYWMVATFPQREFVRFIVCALLMIPVALVIGANYPIVMELLAGSAKSDRAGKSGKTKIRTVGYGMAVNTAGNILGALFGTFVLMPLFGSLRALHVLAVVSFALAAWVLWYSKSAVAKADGKTFLMGADARPSLMALFVGAALLAFQPSELNWTKLSTGANVYFFAQGYGEVMDHAESADGGLTTVARSMHDHREVKTLLTNGKFQGDDNPSGEIRAQLAFGLVPLLHTTERGRALVIGLGTGVSARTIRDAGFNKVEVAELSGDIANLAAKHFAGVNGGVMSDKQHVDVHITDGRNRLMLSKESYDLVSIEISSIWFAGAASLYNQEFYELIKSKLTKRGVLQQWVQLHRLYPHDLATVIGTLRASFPYAWLYFVGSQGMLIGCMHDCGPDLAAIDKLNKKPELAESLKFYDGKAEVALRERILDGAAIDAFVASVRPESPIAAISTDESRA